MKAKFRRPKKPEDALHSLNIAIEALDLARDNTTLKPARNAIYSTSALLATIRDSVINEAGFVELGLACAAICQSLDRGMKGSLGAPPPGAPILEAVEQLTTSMVEIQRLIVKQQVYHFRRVLLSLSLTYRNNGFITMLVPLRDYLCPEDPLSLPILCATREHYFTRLSAEIDPVAPGFRETRWITSEDANVEHLLSVLMSSDPNSDDVWRACDGFLQHLYWHKPRQTVLGPRIEGLPDDHPSKPGCLFGLAWLFQLIGNHTERKRLFEHSLRLERERGDDFQVASVLSDLSDVNRVLGLRKEGIGQALEALEIHERVSCVEDQGDCLVGLALLLCGDGQLDAAEEAASRAIKILPEKGEEWRVCNYHGTLGIVYRSKGEKEKALHHFETALTIASTFGWSHGLFWTHYDLAILFRDEDDFDNAHAHTKQARSHTDDDPYLLGRAILLRAQIYYQQRRREESASEALRAFEILKMPSYLQELESDFSGEPLEVLPTAWEFHKRFIRR